MRPKIILVILICTILLQIVFAEDPHPKQNHPAPAYGYKGVLNNAVLFAKGVITTPDDEFGGTFTPDGKTCYFSKSVLRFYLDVICFSEFKNGKWQTPAVAPFQAFTVILIRCFLQMGRKWFLLLIAPLMEN